MTKSQIERYKLNRQGDPEVLSPIVKWEYLDLNVGDETFYLGNIWNGILMGYYQTSDGIVYADAINKEYGINCYDVLRLYKSTKPDTNEGREEHRRLVTGEFVKLLNL